MTIRNPVLFGLKVAFNFADAESKIQCLTNLGLDIRDLNVIRGISASGLDKVDLQNVSGLDVNLTRYLDRLKSDTGLYAGIVNELGGYQYTLRGNLEAYGPLSGGAVRYQYIPNDRGTGLTKADLKYGDISTSRVSAWSAEGEDDDVPISYGASVQVKGTLKVAQSGTWSGPTSTQAVINVLDTPEPIRFPTEVATDVLEVEINGNPRYIYAMRGIPVIFTTAFKNVSIDIKFNTIPSGNPIFTMQATDGSEPEIQSTPPVGGGTSRLRYNSPSYKERYVKLYYPPNSVTGIIANGLNIRELPRVKFFELKEITVSGNLLGEMPDWRSISYAYDRNNPTTAPVTNLTYIDIGNNPLNSTDDEELRQFGTSVIERLPKRLITLYASGTYNGHTTFKTIQESAVILCTAAEYNSIIVDPSTQQTIKFVQDSKDVWLNGYFWDKHIHPISGKYLVYLKEWYITKDTSFTSSDIKDSSAITTALQTELTNYKDYYKVLNLATRCPNLQTFYMRNSSGRRIYANSNTKGPVPSGTSEGLAYQTTTEYTPDVDLETIRTYDIYDNNYTKLSNIFVSPGSYISGDSTLTSFIVGENEGLYQPADSVNFGKMTAISTINIYDTQLPIPSGLAGNSSLRTLECGYTQFPSRGTSPPSDYPNQHPDGGYIDSNGDGNPNNMTNHLFNTKWPTDESEYLLSGCSNLSSLSFYGSRLDGMIPKFIGNGSLTSIDFRYTNIQGGRPKEPGSSLSGRRYVMWDDTFEDAQNIKTIRIRSDQLGVNTGIYDPNTNTWTQAAFQAATFNLPLLETLEIVSPQKKLRGGFFNTSSAPNLQYLYSPSSGWGEDIPNGAPIPSFASNPNLIEINLSGNKFSGDIVLLNASKLQKFYVQSNIIEGVDNNNFSGLGALQYFIASGNQMSGRIPNFSVAAPNIQYISLANNKYGTNTVAGITPFTPGLFSQCTRLRSLDLSLNGMNTATVDDILLEMLANYNNAPRTGVVVNLQGNDPPSKVDVVTPTTTTTTNIESFVVTQSDPLNPQQIFVRNTDFNIDLKTGTDPVNSNFSYSTVIKQNGVDITNTLVSIDYANDTITWTGAGFPPDGATIEITVTTVEQGTITTETGGVVTVRQLRNLGWTVKTN